MKRWTGPELILAALKAAGIKIKKPVPVTPEMISKSPSLQKRKRK